MTIDELQVLALKGGGALLGLLLFYWVRLIMLGSKKR